MLRTEFTKYFRIEPYSALVDAPNYRRPTSGNRLSHFERLEDRALLATFSESGSILQIDLAANESVAITSTGTQYSLALTGGAYSGTNSANVTGNGTSSLTVTAASFTEVKIDDAGASTSVVFNNSGANTYGSSFTVLLDQASAGTITFNGTSSFVGSSAFSATTARNILVNDGATLSTVNGNLTLSANQQATPTSGNFVGVRVGSSGLSTFGVVSVSGTGQINIAGKGGDSSTGFQYGVEVPGGRIQGGSNSVTVSGTGGASTGNGNMGVTISNQFDRVNQGIITSTGGNVSVTGQGGGTGTSNFSFGIQNSAGLQTNPATITAGGMGTVTVTGTGASNGSSTQTHHGVSFQGRITSGGGNVTITGNVASTVAAGSHGINAGNSVVFTTEANGGNLTLLVNEIDIGNSQIVTNSSGSLTIASSVPGRGLDIISTFGSTDPIAGPIQIFPGSEFSAIRTTNLILGSATTGTINVSGNITQLGVIPNIPYNVSLVSGAGINFGAGSIDTKGGNLSITPGTSSSATFAKSGNDIAMGTAGTIGTLSFQSGSNVSFAINGATVDSQYNQLNVIGKVNLTGAAFTRTGSFVPSTQTFLIVSNDGVDPIIGTFTGLAEGATVVLSGVNYVITYSGGDGTMLFCCRPRQC